jgi:acetyltransferase-like isoleucine patch superfamily enzyme
MRETCFPGVELRVGRMEIGEGVRIGEGTVIVADDLVLGAGAVIGPGCDLRSARLEFGPSARVGEGGRLLVADLPGWEPGRSSTPAPRWCAGS